MGLPSHGELHFSSFPVCLERKQLNFYFFLSDLETQFGNLAGNAVEREEGEWELKLKIGERFCFITVEGGVGGG